jgi:hypothetical protein
MRISNAQSSTIARWTPCDHANLSHPFDLAGGRLADREGCLVEFEGAPSVARSVKVSFEIDGARHCDGMHFDQALNSRFRAGQSE